MATGDRRDPFRTFNFQLEIDGIPLGAFSEVSGLSASTDAVDYREGTDLNPSVRKLTGLTKLNNITLKRGMTLDLSLWQWRQNIVNGVQDRRNVTIILLNEQHQQVLRWDAIDAWPTKVEMSGFKAAANEIGIESVELVHEGLQVEAA
jgi:phage tail-like protein